MLICKLSNVGCLLKLFQEKKYYFQNEKLEKKLRILEIYFFFFINANEVGSNQAIELKRKRCSSFFYFTLLL